MLAFGVGESVLSVGVGDEGGSVVGVGSLDRSGDGDGLDMRGVGVGLDDRRGVGGGEVCGARVRGCDRSTRGHARDGDGRFGGGAADTVRAGDPAGGAGRSPATHPGNARPVRRPAAATGAPNTSAVAQRGMCPPRRDR